MRAASIATIWTEYERVIGLILCNVARYETGTRESVRSRALKYEDEGEEEEEEEER